MSTSFELVLDDSSPVISYYPFAETLGAPDLLAGWNSYFSESGFLAKLGQTGTGTSLHVTALDGAALTVQWFGTGISLFGTAFQAAYVVSLDGAAPVIGISSGDVLAEFQGLEAKQHIVELIARPIAIPDGSAFIASYVAFDRAALNVSTDIPGAAIASEFINATDNRWSFSGDWTLLSDPLLASQPSQTYRLSVSRANTASISFQGSAVSITGIRNATYGHYNVTLDGTVTTFDGRSDWLESSTLFLQAGLDEMTKHTLTITNADDAPFVIAGLNITHISGGIPNVDGSSPKLGANTVLVLILAGVVGVLALVSLLAYIYTRRHRPRDSKPGLAIEPRLRYSGTYVDTPDGYSTVLVTPSQREVLDPTSPTPYMRLPKPSLSIDIPGEQSGILKEDEEYGGRAHPRRSTMEANVRDSTGTMMQELLDAHSRPDSHWVTPVMPLPQRSYTRSSSPKRGSSLQPGPLRHLHLDIPSPRLYVTTSIPQMPHSPPHRVPSASGSHLATWRDSFVTSLKGTLRSLSTMQFERPDQDGRDGRDGSSENEHTVTRDHAHQPSPTPTKDRTPGNWLERMRARRG